MGDLALLFLRDGVDDPSLDRELVELFSASIDLCAEFKNLSVYGCSFVPRLRPAQCDSSRRPVFESEASCKVLGASPLYSGGGGPELVQYLCRRAVLTTAYSSRFFGKDNM